MRDHEFPELTHQQADFYVYALIDPRNDDVFYIGKGRGRRAWSHVGEVRSGRISNVAKYERIRGILDAGDAPIVQVLPVWLTECEAFYLERHTIDSYGLDRLTNIAPGRADPEETARQRYLIVLREWRAAHPDWQSWPQTDTRRWIMLIAERNSQRDFVQHCADIATVSADRWRRSQLVCDLYEPLLRERDPCPAR